MTDAEMTDPEPEELADRAALLDALLVDAALGPSDGRTEAQNLAPLRSRSERLEVSQTSA